MLAGDNGILQRATDAKELTEVGQEKESISLAYISVIADKTSRGDTSNISGTELDPAIKKYDAGASSEDGDNQIIVTFPNGPKYSIDGDGKIGEYSPPPSVVEALKIGDYVDYDPTKIDVEKKVDVDSNKLNYISLKGSGASHGNGYDVQSFEASSAIPWRVLSVTEDKIELVSATNIIKKENTDNGKFRLYGAIGYLYSEQELNEICKIFGYGYGAVSDAGGSYEIGGPKDTIEKGKIQETGARCITLEDINKLAGINDFTQLNSNYGKTTYPTTNTYYPTINTSTGKSNSAGVTKIKSTHYTYYLNKISDINIQNMLKPSNYNEMYWLASRSISTQSNRVFYITYFVDYYGEVTGSQALGVGSNDGWSDGNGWGGMQIRPVVTLDSNVIDTSSFDEDTGKDVMHAWKLK